MSDRAFAWAFTYTVALVGWFTHIVSQRWGDTLTLMLMGIVGALLITVLERRLASRKRD